MQSKKNISSSCLKKIYFPSYPALTNANTEERFLFGDEFLSLFLILKDKFFKILDIEKVKEGF